MNDIENLEVFLRDQCKSVEFQGELENIEERCQTENSGSTTLKEIHLLVHFVVILNLHWLIYISEVCL